MPSQNGRLSSKFYCVTRGHIAGVFTDYAVVQQQLERFSGNSFQSVKGHISDAYAYMLKLGTVYWQDHTEQTVGNWDQPAQHAGYIAARDEFWEDPCYLSVAVDIENVCHGEEHRQREHRKRAGVKNAYDSTSHSGEGPWFMDALAFVQYKPDGEYANSKPALSYIIQRMQDIHLEIASREKVIGTPATDLIQQWAKEEARAIQDVYALMLDTPSPDQHADILRQYHLAALNRVYKLRQSDDLFKNIQSSEKACIYKWDRKESVSRNRLESLIGAEPKQGECKKNTRLHADKTSFTRRTSNFL
jgi:hypothetical protein